MEWLLWERSLCNLPLLAWDLTAELKKSVCKSPLNILWIYCTFLKSSDIQNIMGTFIFSSEGRVKGEAENCLWLGKKTVDNPEWNSFKWKKKLEKNWITSYIFFQSFKCSPGWMALEPLLGCMICTVTILWLGFC